MHHRAEKRLSLAAYGDRRPIWDYEYDHFVPLELGGATNDPRNLWPEPGASPNPKDAVENYLNREVCDHTMTLARAQAAIVANWVAIYRQLHAPSNPKPPAGPSARAAPAPNGAASTTTTTSTCPPTNPTRRRP